MSTLTPPPDGDVNRAGSLIAMYCIQCTISLILVTARIWTRYQIGGLGRDDVVLVITALTFLGLTIMVVIFGTAGALRHLYYIPPEQILYVTKLIFIAQPFVELSCSLSRVSVAFLLMRILGRVRDWREWFLWACIPITLTLAILTSFFAFFQCQNPAALWTPALQATTYCWNPVVKVDFTYFVDGFNAFLDVAMVIIGWTIIYPLQMPARRKFGTIGLLSIGLLAAIFAIVKTTLLPELLDFSDLTYATYGLWACAGWEILLSIICATVPTLKPLYERYASKNRSKKTYIGMEDRSNGSKTAYSSKVSNGSNAKDYQKENSQTELHIAQMSSMDETEDHPSDNWASES